jgi:hypothetical protein
VSLAAALAAETAVPLKGPPCRFREYGLLEADGPLSDDERAVLTAYLADPKVSHAAISRALCSEGFKVGQGTVARHRKGECQCEVQP